MSEFLNSYLFHWVPSKAIWIGGYTLSWDARCSGIYIGFGAGVLYQLAAEWKAWRIPSARFLVINALFMLPLFLDVFAIRYNFKAPSNDTRYLTGLLWGGAFSIYIFPAVMILICSDWHERKVIKSWIFFTPLLAISAAAFVLKEWNNVLAYGVLEALCVFGFLSLLGILSFGMFKAVKSLVLKRSVVQIALLITILSIISGCAATTRSIKSDMCNERDFVSSQNVCGDCKKEFCKDGRVVLVEDLTQTAPVDDWAEEKFCLWHPINCYKAYALKHKMEQWQEEMSGKYWTRQALHNGLGDGARHARLMCMFTEQFGVDFARVLGVAHEEDSEYLIFFQKGVPGNPCCEKVADSYNNEIGIMLAGKPGSCEEKVLNSLHLLRHSLCAIEEKGMER